MKKVQFSIIMSLILILGVGIGQGVAQCPPPVSEWIDEVPKFHVGISIGSGVGDAFVPKNTFELSEDLMVVMSLDAIEELITSAGFIDRDFYLMLYFYDSDCNLITANNPVELTDPLPPLLKNNQQTVMVERLPGDPSKLPLKIGPFNAHTYYTLSEPGKYKVLARVFMRTYSEGDVDRNGYVLISSAIGHGTIESNTEEIELYVPWGTGRPAALQMEYTGESCEATSTPQADSYWSCTDSPEALPSPNSEEKIYITAASKSKLDHKNTTIWLNEYELDLKKSDDTFWIDARVLGEAMLAGDTFIWIYDEPGGNLLLQTVIFHSSGSEPLNYGDQYGSLKLVGFVPAE